MSKVRKIIYALVGIILSLFGVAGIALLMDKFYAEGITSFFVMIILGALFFSLDAVFYKEPVLLALSEVPARITSLNGTDMQGDTICFYKDGFSLENEGEILKFFSKDKYLGYSKEDENSIKLLSKDGNYLIVPENRIKTMVLEEQLGVFNLS